jgi:pilus assembly protein CpaF
LRDEGVVLGDRAVLELVAAVTRDLAGAGPLEQLLDDPAVSDVLVNGPDEVWVDRGDGLVRAPVRLADESAVRRLAQRLAATAGRRLDAAAPTVDARLAGGVRLHAVLPPISPRGTVVSLRVAPRRAFTLDALTAAGSMPPALADALREIVAARLAFLVTGGTGTGKTTLLSTLLSLVPPRERIVLVEDSGELLPDHPHVVRLEARPPNIEGSGRIDLRDLVREALRMRPDRLVVGEVRGGEVVDLLAALNTGHEGGCGTVHANAPDAVPARLEALASAAGLGREALHSQLAAGVDAVVHLTRDRSGARRVSGIATLHRGGDGWVRVLPALTSTDGGVAAGPGLDAIRARVRGAVS